ncbi:DUF1761 domain-containing protein [Roseisalinus antarcticus]|uniref:DUF1761 domain-containing protein n=1 Tax=Roseisalinus antarcticus TaxID=254357 RepID=A0A1Y5S1F4_9RHOB|nr:DUF1761 domain-containing protein [Roseisalinus antarcticus]SLN30434.1 hypothetical protein ROA7023_01034 [Roseisalinus antarcticus]
MGFLNVIVAAFAGFAFGALWYGLLSGPWMAAANVPTNAKGQPANASTPVPYVLSFVCILIVAGMMRHIFALSAIDTLGEGLVAGFGIGAFFISPWIVLNNGYAMRPMKLSLIDSGYATFGCTIVGLVLTLF